MHKPAEDVCADDRPVQLLHGLRCPCLFFSMQIEWLSRAAPENNVRPAGEDAARMTTYAIIGAQDDSRLKAAMNHVFPERYFQFGPGQFVAIGNGLTSAQVANHIGTNEQVGQYVVFLISGYWGYHRRDLWEWLTANGG